MTRESPPSDGPAFDAMFSASLAGMVPAPATPESLRLAIQTLIDRSGLSQEEVAMVLGELAGQVG